MNIFFLSLIVQESALFHNDKHVVKMILELCQMLWSAHYVLNNVEGIAKAEREGIKVYRNTHSNHPMTVWVRSSYINYLYTCFAAVALCYEYTYRYSKKKVKQHLSQVIIEWLYFNPPSNFPMEIPYCEGTNYATINIPYLTRDNNIYWCTPVPITITNKELHVYRQIDTQSGYDLIASYRNYYCQEKTHIASWTGRDTPYWYKPST